MIASNGHSAVRPSPDTPPATASAEGRQLNGAPFPFATELSLAPLVAFWHQTMRREHPVEGATVTRLQQALQEAPALLEPITDVAVIAQHQALVDTLMSVIFPRASWEDVHAAALWPFHLQSFYATPPFARLLVAADGSVRGRANIDQDVREQVRMLYAYALILRRVYG